jgi:predicted transcriptional regulator
MSNKSKRSRMQLFAEILSLCQKPRTKTRVMYRTNLSYTLVNDLLEQLQKSSLIEVHYRKERYATTEKGLAFLQKWTELQQLMVTKEPLLSYPQLSRVPDDWNEFRVRYFR